MKVIGSLFVLFSLLLASCNTAPSLQKYFVENTENKNFVALDISPSILNVDTTKLSVDQNKALQSFDKINVLAFKINHNNKAQFEVELAKVNGILNEAKYQQLMKLSSGKEGASLYYIDSDGPINELVLYANKKDSGFVLVRILGKDMNPTNCMTMISVLKSSKINLEQLKPLQELFKK
jgi:hypothetical protein